MNDLIKYVYIKALHVKIFIIHCIFTKFSKLVAFKRNIIKLIDKI